MSDRGSLLVWCFQSKGLVWHGGASKISQSVWFKLG